MFPGSNGVLKYYFPAFQDLPLVFTDFTATAAGCIFYFAFLGTTLGFIWFYDGVKKLGASRAAMYVNLVPVSGILLGTLFLDEHLGSSLLIGGVPCLFRSLSCEPQGRYFIVTIAKGYLFTERLSTPGTQESS